MAQKISQETKDRIIDKIKNEGMSVPQASKEFGLAKNTIYNWIGVKNQGTPGILEMAKIKKENLELKQIIGGLTLNMERGKKNRQSQVYGRQVK